MKQKIDQVAVGLIDAGQLTITEQLARQEGVDEALKARNQLLWIQRMNSLRQQAEEIVMEDVLYSL